MHIQEFIELLFGSGFKRYGPTYARVIDQIIENKRTILNEYVDSNEEHLGKKVLDKYEKYQNRLDSDSSFRRNLELEIAGLLLDMKAIIADDEKTRKLLQKVDEGNFELDS